MQVTQLPCRLATFPAPMSGAAQQAGDLPLSKLRTSQRAGGPGQETRPTLV